MLRKIFAIILAFVLTVPLLTVYGGEDITLRDGIEILDVPELKITFLYISSGSDGVGLELLIENKTTQDICLQSRSESINEYMISADFSAYVPAGGKVESMLKFPMSQIKLANITYISDMCLSFRVFDNDDNELYWFEPIYFKLECGIGYGATESKNKQLFYSTEYGGVTVSYVGCEYDNNGDLKVILFAENDTSDHLLLQARDGKVNGYDVHASLARDIHPGKKAYIYMVFKGEALKAHGISSVNEIAFSLLFTKMLTEEVVYKTNPYTIRNSKVYGDIPSGEPSYVVADNIKVFVNNHQLYIDQSPIIINNRTLVPLRAIFEALGCSVSWDGATQTVTAQTDNKTISLSIGANQMVVNDNTVIIDVAPIAVNNRTLVPVRAISEAFDCTVTWDGNTQTVYVTQ